MRAGAEPACGGQHTQAAFAHNAIAKRWKVVKKGEIQAELRRANSI